MSLEMEWLRSLASRLRREFGLHAVAACEIEFRLATPTDIPEAEILTWLDTRAAEAGLHAHPAEKERAPGQYEIALWPMADACAMAEATLRLKTCLEASSAARGWRCDFAAKKENQLIGNGLHIHLHLEDEDGKRVFSRSPDGEYSESLLYVVAGLLENMQACMPLFAPHAESYRRYAPPRDGARDDAPTHVCWGPNNRTAAIRLPPKALDAKHLEHRVGGADADPALALGGVLFGAIEGLRSVRRPPEPVHGQAHKPIYALTPLPGSLAQAQALFRADTALQASMPAALQAKLASM